jgi:hypothetical protein
MARNAEHRSVASDGAYRARLGTPGWPADCCTVAGFYRYGEEDILRRLSAPTLHDGTPLGRMAALRQFSVGNFPTFARPAKAVTVVTHDQ